ncbi:restin homolog isoform X2 [Watersipora subatra]
MDSEEETICIPIKEYENYRNCHKLQDNQSILRDLQKLLITRDEDVKRYKEKSELLECKLLKTQKTLDNCIQSEHLQSTSSLKTTAHRPVRVVAPLKKSQPKPMSTADSSDTIEVVSRAIGDDSPVKKASSQTSSLTAQTRRLSISEDSTNIKSLPPSLSVVGSPGMSTALLKKLVQENLKLKAQLDRRQLPKQSKTSEELEKVINDLKGKLSKKQLIIDDLVNQGGSQGQVASRLEALHKEVDYYRETAEMDKIVIDALKQDNIQAKRDKEEIENALHHCKPFKGQVVEMQERIAKLERSLKEETERRKDAELRIDSLTKEVENVKQILEKAEEDRELAEKNYNTLASQFHKSTDRHPTIQPPFMSKAPQLVPPQHSSQPASLPQPAYSFSQSMYGEIPRVQSRSQVLSRSPSPQSPAPRKLPESLSTYASKGLAPSAPEPPSRMVQSSYTLPTHAAAHAGVQLPSASERKTFKCPRCDTKFMVLQEYRNHIKICLKG